MCFFVLDFFFLIDEQVLVGKDMDRLDLKTVKAKKGIKIIKSTETLYLTKLHPRSRARKFHLGRKIKPNKLTDIFKFMSSLSQ